MIEKAVVLTTTGNKAIVAVKRSTACENCGAKCMIGKENLTVKAEVENIVGAKAGDTVNVELELSSVLSASFIAYGIPFAAFLIGCAFGYYFLSRYILMSKDILALLTGLVLITASYLLIRYLDKKGAFKQRFSIKIVR